MINLCKIVKNSILLGFCLLIGSVAHCNESKADHKLIEGLLNKVKSCQCRFERNGDRHSSNEAYNHLKRKYDYARKPILYWQKRTITVDQFINKIASSSSTTGKPYFIITKDKKRKMKEWLEEQLKKIKSKDI